MVDVIHEEKTARQLDRLSEALDSGVKYRVTRLISGLSAAEIGDGAIWRLVEVKDQPITLGIPRAPVVGVTFQVEPGSGLKAAAG